MKNFFTKYGKIVCPVAVLVIAAIVVVLALQLKNNEPEVTPEIEPEPIVVEVPDVDPSTLDIPLEENQDSSLDSFFQNYYGFLSSGDLDGITNVCDTIDQIEGLRMMEQSKYLNYQVKEIYTQAGPEDGSYIAYVYAEVIFDSYPDILVPAYNGYYVKTGVDGQFYIVKGELSDKENEYISVMADDETVNELNNRINVDYNDVVLANPSILEYLSELDTIVNTAVGEKLASLNTTVEDPAGAANGSDSGTTDPGTTDPNQTQTAENVIRYATASTTVNVRVSDSENADKMGQVTIGTKLQVQEVLANGWTKLLYKDKTGYVKSEFLTMAESAADYETIGNVKATTTVNVRVSPDQNADRIGVLVDGDLVELVAKENGWCKIKYDGQIGYVNADFVQ